MKNRNTTIANLNTEARRLYRMMEKRLAHREWGVAAVVPIATAVRNAAYEFLRGNPDAPEETRGAIWSIGHAASLAAHCRDAAGYVGLREHLKGGFEKLDGLAAPAPFVPTPIQSAILEALNGKALKVEALVDAIGYEPQRLYKPGKDKPGGIHELKARGLVVHKHGVGYFRPDAPPPR